jgi:ankyrin repeat protein
MKPNELNCTQTLSCSANAPRPRRASPARGLLAAMFAASTIGALCAALPAHATSVDTLVKDTKFDDVKGVAKDLAAGLDVNATDDRGTPLIVIAAKEKSDKVAALLAGNPKTNLEAVDRAGENALMMAALNGDVGLVKLLLSRHVAVNKAGWAPLHYAVTNGHDDVVRLLVAHGAQVNAPSPNGSTALMLAARGDHLPTIKLLLANGAALNAKNSIGLTALDFAYIYKSPDAIRYLAAQGGQRTVPDKALKR